MFLIFTNPYTIEIRNETISEGFFRGVTDLPNVIEGGSGVGAVQLEKLGQVRINDHLLQRAGAVRLAHFVVDSVQKVLDLPEIR